MKRIPITVVFHLEARFDDDADENLIRFMVEENGCVDNYIDDLAERRDAEDEHDGACFGCEVGEAFVGHLPLAKLRALARGECLYDKAAQALSLARSLATEPTQEPYLCRECGQPVADFSWHDGPLGPAICSVRTDGSTCHETEIGSYLTEESALGRLDVLRVHGRRAQAGGGR